MSAATGGFRLERASDAGLYMISAAQADALLRAARAAGIHGARLDLSDRPGKAGLLAGMADVLQFPDWFGHNWDAFADCLEDLQWLPADGYLLVLENAAGFRATWPHDYRTCIEILEGVIDAWRERGVPFWVFIVRPAPA